MSDILDKINNTVSSVGGKVAGAAGEFVRQKKKEIGKLVDPERPERFFLGSSPELKRVKALYTKFAYLNTKLECLKLELEIVLAAGEKEKLPEILEKLRKIEEALEKG